jgi:hypothetical protein
MTNIYILFCVLFLRFSQKAFCQLNYRNAGREVSVILKSDSLSNAWAGGLNATTIASIDCNLDNKDDLLVFDRVHHKAFVFLNERNQYIYSKTVSQNLPKLSKYALTFDFNKDGKKDIFTSSALGITVFKNISTANDLVFEKVADPIFTYYSPSYSNMNIGTNDVPSLTDVDNDGDMDILHFNNVTGVSVIWERNMSIEKFGIPDSLDFKQTDDCWGGFQEQTCTTYYFGFDCLNNFRLEHVGAGSLLALDMDNDGDKEVVLSKEDCTNLNYLINKGDASIAFFNKRETTFSFSLPTNSIPYPISAFEDVDFDGNKDLIVTLGQTPITGKTDLSKNLWWYKNTGSNQIPAFSFQSKNFLQNTMIDLGQNSHPALADFDNDGDLDLFVSNATNIFTKGASIYLFENIGSKNNATFQLADTNYLNLAQFGYDELGIKFADINNDNKTDLVLSTQKETIFSNKLFLNQSSSTFTFGNSTDLNFGLDEIPSFEFYDIDKDNLKDALVGTYFGEILYYQNTGTKDAPTFTLIDSDFGNIGSTNFSRTILIADTDQDGKTDLITSDDEGILKLYADFENQTKPFNHVILKEGAKNLSPVGNRLSFTMGDLNNDKKPEMIIGNDNGGLQLYFATEDPNAIESNMKSDFEFSLFPNPNNGNFKIQSSTKGAIEITDLTGHILVKSQIETDKPFELSTELPKGIYFVSLDKMGVRKIVVDR